MTHHSISPAGKVFALPTAVEIAANGKDLQEEVIRQRAAGRSIVIVQGLGFVGSAVAAVVSAARDGRGSPVHFVIGIDLPTPGSYWKIAMLNEGLVPFASPDPEFDELIHEAVVKVGNLRATTSESLYQTADVIIVDVNLDARERIVTSPSEITVRMDGFEKAIRAVGRNMHPDALVLVETTVPVGTCEHIVDPILREERAKRGISEPPKLAHAYERVMPGPHYVNSIRRFWRSYSGMDQASGDAAQKFLSTFIDVASHPLCRLERPAASEMAKLLENSYRAVNIAFMYEWTLLAERIGVNLFEVVESIRVRKGTHDNMRFPGFGVGGYCLTKDSYLAQWGALNLFKMDVTLEMTLAALRTNYLMPRHTLDLLIEMLGDSVRGANVAVLGVSYLPEVGDTRSSPTELFFDELREAGATAILHDPMVRHWAERPEIMIRESLEETLRVADAVVMAVPHNAYKVLTAARIASLAPKNRAIVDAQNMLSDADAQTLANSGCRVAGVGKGHWRRMGLNLEKNEQ